MNAFFFDLQLKLTLEDVEEAANGRRQAEADQCKRNRSRGKCDKLQKSIQSPHPLHSRKGQECSHTKGLFTDNDLHRQRSPCQPMDSDSAALLQHRSKGITTCYILIHA